jgi:hypothetical protein
MRPSTVICSAKAADCKPTKGRSKQRKRILFIEAKLPSSLQKALGLSRQGKGKKKTEEDGYRMFHFDLGWIR